MTVREAIEILESANSKLGDYFPNYQNAVNKIIEKLKEKEQGMGKKIEIEVETKGFDEMNEKMETAINNAEDLSEALEFPSIIIKQSRDCVFNITIRK